MGAASTIALHKIALLGSARQEGKALHGHWQVLGAKATSTPSPHRSLTKSQAGAPRYRLPIISHAIKSPVDLCIKIFGSSVTRRLTGIFLTFRAIGNRHEVGKDSCFCFFGLLFKTNKSKKPFRHKSIRVNRLKCLMGTRMG